MVLRKTSDAPAISSAVSSCFRISISLPITWKIRCHQCSMLQVREKLGPELVVSPDLQSLNDGQLNASSGVLGPTFSTSSFCLARLPLIEPMSSANGQEGKRFILCILQTDGSPEVDREVLPLLWRLNSMNCTFFGFLRAVSAHFSRQWTPSKRLEIPFFFARGISGPNGGNPEKKGHFSTSLLVQNVFKTSENHTNKEENICFDAFWLVQNRRPRNASKRLEIFPVKSGFRAFASFDFP